MALIPSQLTPVASLNRVIFLPLPDVAPEPDDAGKSAYELLSSAAIVALVRAATEAAGCDVIATSDAELLRLCDRWFEEDDPTLRSLAKTLAEHLGRRLGYLVLTLKRGAPPNRVARPEWDDSYWAYWSCIERVWIGGGIAEGNLGHSMCRVAQEFLVSVGVADCVIERAVAPQNLALIGAARSVPGISRCALVFDFGQTYVKRAHVRYEERALVALHILPPIATIVDPAYHAEAELRIQSAALAQWMADIMAETWLACAVNSAPEPTIVASIASYIVDNHPIPRQGGPYAALHTLSPPLGSWLASEISRQIGRSINVELLHDGTAAARRYVGANQTAVIMLGTALGVGFAVANEDLRPLADIFSIQ